MIFLIFSERNRIESEGEFRSWKTRSLQEQQKYNFKEKPTSPKNKHPKSNLMSKWQFARYQAKKIESSVLTDKVWLFQSVYDTTASAARARVLINLLSSGGDKCQQKSVGKYSAAPY